jgi:uncharacterized membrane-anchored protein
MNKKRIIFIVFILVALAQLFIPAKMIIDREDILATGKEYKFKTRPIDPNDPFRGKYITLGFEENRVKGQNENNWKNLESIYVLLSTDEDGFARIQSISKVKPAGKVDFVKAKVSYFSFPDPMQFGLDSLNLAQSNKNSDLIIEYPFNRFYMEEFKAPVAEKVYRESLSDSTKVAYALVKIKDGDAVVKDIVINGISINEIVKKGITF